MINLKKLRENKGCTQEELSKALGISRSHISNMENNKVNITIKNAKKFANYFKEKTIKWTDFIRE